MNYRDFTEKDAIAAAADKCATAIFPFVFIGNIPEWVQGGIGIALLALVTFSVIRDRRVSHNPSLCRAHSLINDIVNQLFFPYSLALANILLNLTSANRSTLLYWIAAVTAVLIVSVTVVQSRREKPEK